MNNNDLMSLLSSNDMLDENLGLKKDNVVKCPRCNEELYIYNPYSMLYCPKCDIYVRNKEKNITNKTLKIRYKRNGK